MPKKGFPRKGVVKFYLVHGSARRDEPEWDEQRPAARQRGEHVERAQPIEHEDGTVEFGYDPDYDRRDWEYGEYGFPDDGHDYSQYFKPMGQRSGVFVGIDGNVSTTLPIAAEYAPPTLGPTDFAGDKERERQEAKRKRKQRDGEFVLREEEEAKKKSADGEQKEEDGDEGEVDENGEKVVVLGVPFVVQERDDFEMQKELHYRTMERPDAVLDKILDAPKDKDVVDGVHVEEMPDDFIQQLMEGDNDDDDLDGYGTDGAGSDGEVSRRPAGDALAAMEEQFDEVLKDYDSDDIGDLSGDEDVCGTMSVEDILAHLEAEETKNVDKLLRMHAAAHVLRGPLVDHQYKDDDADAAAAARGDTTVFEDGAAAVKVQHRKNKKIEEILSYASEAPDDETRKKILALVDKEQREGEKKVAVEVEDDDAPDERWDCESVLSTLSSTSNAPTVIGDDDDDDDDYRDESARRKNAARAKKNAPAAQPIIQLSRKTGMPVEILREQQQQRDGGAAAAGAVGKKKNLGEARTKKETPEEKKARKKAVKQAAQERRAQKKQLKNAYKEAESKQARTIQAQALSLGGQSVLHM